VLPTHNGCASLCRAAGHCHRQLVHRHTASLLTGAVGLAKDPGMVGAETEFMTGTGDGIVVGVVRSGMVLSVGSGTMVGSRTPCPGWSTAR
jgi:hypothetical protein